MPEQGCLFHDLFLNNLKAGTCATGKLSSRWKDEAFAGEVGCTVRALGYWKSGERAPSERALNRIVSVLFGDNPSHSEAKAAFIAAWNDRAAGRSYSGHATARPSTQHPQHKAHGGSMAPDWVPEQPFVLRDGLGRLYVHRENQGDTPGASVTLEVTAETGRAYLRIPETEDTPRFDATFAVASAEIVVVKDMNVTPVKDTTLGTANRPHPNVIFAGSWQLRIPLAGDGEPGGVVLAGDTLRHYSAKHEDMPCAVRLELRCRDIDLKPIGVVTPPDISEKQRAVLQRLLQGADADPTSGTISLARDELFRRSSS